MADQNLQSLHPFLQTNSTTLSVGGVIKSFSHDTGSGPVLCLVHGWPQSSYMWRHTVATLKEQASLYIPELPGYGFSTLPSEHDKRYVGNLIVEALYKVFDKSRPIIWCGHDRGARIGHRLVVDADHGISTHRISTAIFLDIVPTLEQWRVFANPAASVAYYHWPFLASPAAPLMIESMGGGNFTKLNLEKARGSNVEGAAQFRGNDAMAVYCHQFNDPHCIAGSCADYRAGATVDYVEQEQDQKADRKVKTPLLVIYSAENLGRMHDVPTVWRNWATGELRCEGIADGFGHYLPEECPDRVSKLVLAWIAQHKQ